MRRGADIFEISDEPLGYPPAEPAGAEACGDAAEHASAPRASFVRTVSGTCLLLALVAVAGVLIRSSENGEGRLPTPNGAGGAGGARRTQAPARPRHNRRAHSERSDARRQFARRPPRRAVTAPASVGETVPVAEAPARVVVVLRAPAHEPSRDPRAPAPTQAEREFGFER